MPLLWPRNRPIQYFFSHLFSLFSLSLLFPPCRLLLVSASRQTMVLSGECPPNHQKKDPKSAKGPLIGCLDTMLLTARRRSHSGPGVCSQAQDHIERLRRLGEIRPSVFSRSPRALGPAGPMMHSIPRWRHHLIKSDGAQRHQIITFRFAANCRRFVSQSQPEYEGGQRAQNLYSHADLPLLYLGPPAKPSKTSRIRRRHLHP